MFNNILKAIYLIYSKEITQHITKKPLYAALFITSKTEHSLNAQKENYVNSVTLIMAHH